MIGPVSNLLHSSVVGRRLPGQERPDTGLFEKVIAIPPGLTQGKSTVEVKASAEPDGRGDGLMEMRMVEE